MTTRRAPRQPRPSPQPKTSRQRSQRRRRRRRPRRHHTTTIDGTNDHGADDVSAVDDASHDRARRLAGDPHRAVTPTGRPVRGAGPGADRRVLRAGRRLRPQLEAQLGDAIAKGQHIEGQQPFTIVAVENVLEGEPSPRGHTHRRGLRGRTDRDAPAAHRRRQRQRRRSAHRDRRPTRAACSRSPKWDDPVAAVAGRLGRERWDRHSDAPALWRARPGGECLLERRCSARLDMLALSAGSTSSRGVTTCWLSVPPSPNRATPVGDGRTSAFVWWSILLYSGGYNPFDPYGDVGLPSRVRVGCDDDVRHSATCTRSSCVRRTACR